jgi:hypothetical protein
VDTKVASEQVVLQAHAAGEVACTIVRPGDVYGPGSYFWTLTAVREIAARRLVLPAMGRGKISPVYVDDVVEGVTLAAAHERAIGQVFTLSGGHDVEARDFWGRYARMLGKGRVPVAPTPVVMFIAAVIDRSPAARLHHRGHPGWGSLLRPQGHVLDREGPLGAGLSALRRPRRGHETLRGVAARRGSDRAPLSQVRVGTMQSETAGG